MTTLGVRGFSARRGDVDSRQGNTDSLLLCLRIWLLRTRFRLLGMLICCFLRSPIAPQVPHTYRAPWCPAIQVGDLDGGDGRQGKRRAGPAYGRPRPLLDWCLWSLRELDSEGPLEGALGLLEEQNRIENLSQSLGPPDVFRVFDGDLDPPILGPSYLQHKLARCLVDAPHLALGQDWLERGAAAEEGY